MPTIDQVDRQWVSDRLKSAEDRTARELNAGQQRVSPEARDALHRTLNEWPRPRRELGGAPRSPPPTPLHHHHPPIRRSILLIIPNVRDPIVEKRRIHIEHILRIQLNRQPL